MSWSMPGNHSQQKFSSVFSTLLQPITIVLTHRRSGREFDRSLPDRAFVVALTRDERMWIPDESEIVESSDRLTILGRLDTVEEATHHLISLRDEGSIDFHGSDDDD